MSKDARSQDLELTATEKEKFGELVALLARHGFGEAGPPRKTTFAQIEKFGHQAGQMLARAIDARLESFVKEINARVKGTDKFWNDGVSGEAILQIRAAAL